MDQIFKYPAVQYIPLQLYEIKTGNNPFHGTRPDIKINIPYNFSSFLLNLNHTYNKDEYLNILVYNGEVDYIRYRGYEVIMVGEPKPGKYQFFKITKQYFYKDTLIFLLYDGNTGERLARERFELKDEV